MKLIHPHKKIYVKNEKKVKNKQRTKLKIKKKKQTNTFITEQYQKNKKYF
jgi:hypothetical protein